MAPATAVLFFRIAFFTAVMLVEHVADAATVEHTFIISNLRITRVCATRTVAAVNGQAPGPTVEIREGDTLLIHAVNWSPYNMSIHWHGVFQRLSCWADGAGMVTQCPIRPGRSYTYQFVVASQEGTLWWHAHVSFLCETVHGALVIPPRRGCPYPFPGPDGKFPVILGEWCNVDAVAVDKEAFLTGGSTRPADTLTINGDVGDLNNCSTGGVGIYRLGVEQGKTCWV